MGTCPGMKFTKKVWETKAAAVKAEPKKATRYYPAEDVKKKLGNHHNTTKQTKLRAHYPWHRAYPARRPLQGPACGVPQAARLRPAPHHRPIQHQRCAPPSRASVVCDLHSDQDRHFRRDDPWRGERRDVQEAKGREEEERRDFLREGEDLGGCVDARKALQKKVDDNIVAEAGKTPLLKEYLSSKFSLKG